ncbi:conserved hypothetical protein [Lodderomyces elongisporus NRRL YB-4239]|uniref:Uncharacterized protein n=1 Tax=Lodderomyces elongisporus (strain ATCC 11503 / CBS 2605 / JCM 1781 / NBRC 1676 / NRRL YB-4239) TaxID=379508 RepID=A5E3Y3_LODEL|nr:conserved hypothetical protein [Lodderomyces elongisporus NRRL YB-4239]
MSGSYSLPYSSDLGVSPPHDLLKPFKPQQKLSSLDTVLHFVNRHKKIVLAFITLICLSLFTDIPYVPHFKSTSPKVVIILAANEGGGVLKWKSPQEWSVERSSIANKKHYAKQHGYGLTIKDMTIKKRYSHEWRESWEKVDILKQTMRQFPQTEWFWWLDLHTYIIHSLDFTRRTFLNNLYNATYRTFGAAQPFGACLLIFLYVDSKATNRHDYYARLWWIQSWFIFGTKVILV